MKGLLIGLLGALAATGALAAKPSDRVIVYIVCSDHQGHESHGTGVVISDRGDVITAKHVVPDGYDCKGGLGSAATDPARKLIRRKPSSTYDAIKLQFVPNPGEKFDYVKYLSIDDKLRGQGIFAYGFPEGGTGQVSVRHGVIATTTEDQQGDLETDALTAAGMSGGAVFLSNTDTLIGIVGGAHFDTATGLPTDYAVLAVEMVGDELGVKMWTPPPIAKKSDLPNSPADTHVTVASRQEATNQSDTESEGTLSGSAATAPSPKGDTSGQEISGDPAVILRTLISAFQHCGPATAYQILGSNLFQTIAMQTAGTGCYQILGQAGDVASVSLVRKTVMPDALVLNFRVTHVTGQVFDWQMAESNTTARIEALTFSPVIQTAIETNSKSLPAIGNIEVR